MARIRNIKPQFFKDSDLYDAEVETGLPIRVAYAGLWTVADRAGRFKWKPREIGADILPYDKVDMVAVLAALVKYRFIFKYKAAGFDYGFIPNFEKHQFINRNEAQSTIPAPPENSNAQSDTISEPADCYEYTGTLDTDTDGLTQTEVVPPAVAVAPSKPLRGSRWPSDQEVPADWLARAKANVIELGREPPDLRLEAAKFVNYWSSKAGKDAAKTDWEKTFLNWCLNARSTDQRNFAERRFSSLEKGARGAAFVDGGQGARVEDPRDNLVRLAIPSKPG